jgi:glutaredoxin 3
MTEQRRLMPPGSIHIARDTEHGPECLCGCEAGMLVYPTELIEHTAEVICPTCRRLHDYTARNKLLVEVFSAGCVVCEETIGRVKRIAGESCDVRILDIRQKEVAARANELCIRSVPAVVINGKVADRSTRGPEEELWRAEGLGIQLP